MSTPTCTEAGCTHPAVALGLCHAHYTLRPRSAGGLLTRRIRAALDETNPHRRERAVKPVDLASEVRNLSAQVRDLVGEVRVLRGALGAMDLLDGEAQQGEPSARYAREATR